MQNVTESSVRQFINDVGAQQHAMAGAVIAASAAQAAALGKACMQITLDQTPGALNKAEVAAQIDRMDRIKDRLVQWCDRDATAIAEFVALREAGQELQGQQLLCDAPADIGRLAFEAAQAAQAFRPLVAEQVRDDLEMSLALLTAAAHTAMLLLDSNLRLWPDRNLLDRYEPVVNELIVRIRGLKPVERIR